MQIALADALQVLDERIGSARQVFVCISAYGLQPRLIVFFSKPRGPVLDAIEHPPVCKIRRHQRIGPQTTMGRGT